MSNLESFDVLSSDFLADPYAYYERLHRKDYIYLDKASGAYFIGKYDDVENILRNPIFTTEPLAKRAQPVMGDRVLAQMEGTEHSTKRKMVVKGLNGKYFEEHYQPMIENITKKLIEPLLQIGHIDLIQDFGKDYAVLVTLGILGLPNENYHQIANWHKGVANFITKLRLSEKERVYSLTCSKKLIDFLFPIVEYRKKNPNGNDLISILCIVQNKEEAMTTKEIIALCLNILLAATEPADKSLALLFKHLLDNPKIFNKVKKNRKLMRSAIEETLRLTSPVQLIPREASETTIISNIAIPKGTTVFNMIGAANRDPQAFFKPNEFILDRKVNNTNNNLTIKKRHLAFGTGTHACLGAQFSLKQIEITANILLDYLPNLKLTKGAYFTEKGLYTRGPDSLQLDFDVIPANQITTSDLEFN